MSNPLNSAVKKIMAYHGKNVGYALNCLPSQGADKTSWDEFEIKYGLDSDQREAIEDFRNKLDVSDTIPIFTRMLLNEPMEESLEEFRTLFQWLFENVPLSKLGLGLNLFFDFISTFEADPLNRKKYLKVFEDEFFKKKRSHEDFFMGMRIAKYLRFIINHPTKDLSSVEITEEEKDDDDFPIRKKAKITEEKKDDETVEITEEENDHTSPSSPKYVPSSPEYSPSTPEYPPSKYPLSSSDDESDDESKANENEFSELMEKKNKMEKEMTNINQMIADFKSKCQKNSSTKDSDN